MGDHKLSTRKPQQRQLSQRRARKTTVPKCPHLTANATNLFDVLFSFQHCSSGPPTIDWHVHMHACYIELTRAVNDREVYRFFFFLLVM